MRVLASTVLLWLVVDALFADLYQRFWDLCARAEAPTMCHGVHSFSGDLSSAISAFYFSTTTLATVGYGDITPTLPATRLLVTVEVILGIGLLAFLLGRVVAYAPTRSVPDFGGQRGDSSPTAP